jgi:hypothetical protein
MMDAELPPPPPFVAAEAESLAAVPLWGRSVELGWSVRFPLHVQLRNTERGRLGSTLRAIKRHPSLAQGTL